MQLQRWHGKGRHNEQAIRDPSNQGNTIKDRVETTDPIEIDKNSQKKIEIDKNNLFTTLDLWK